MAKSCSGHGQAMAKPRPGHRQAMVKPRPSHGQAMAKPSPNHGQTMPRAMAEPWLGQGQANHQTMASRGCNSVRPIASVADPRGDLWGGRSYPGKIKTLSLHVRRAMYSPSPWPGCEMLGRAYLASLARVSGLRPKRSEGLSRTFHPAPSVKSSLVKYGIGDIDC